MPGRLGVSLFVCTKCLTQILPLCRAYCAVAVLLLVCHHGQSRPDESAARSSRWHTVEGADGPPSPGWRHACAKVFAAAGRAAAARAAAFWQAAKREGIHDLRETVSQPCSRHALPNLTCRLPPCRSIADAVENENLGLAPKQFWLWRDLSALSALITGSYFNLLLVSTWLLRAAHSAHTCRKT